MNDKAFRRISRRFAADVGRAQDAHSALAGSLGTITGVMDAQAELEGSPVRLFPEADRLIGVLGDTLNELRDLFENPKQVVE